MSRHQRCASRNCDQTSFAPAFFDSLADEGPEVRHDARRHGGFHHPLGEEDTGQVLAWIRTACGADTADPAEPPRYGRKIDAPGIYTPTPNPQPALNPPWLSPKNISELMMS